MEVVMNLKYEALRYHGKDRKGKIEVIPTKPLLTQRDLSLAYTPGVAEPCLEIARDSSAAYEYTAKGNLVAVVSNGTAVLGLGNIGPLAGKPVMEGKANLFKAFADIDVFDIELDASTPKEVISAVKAIAPTFGGINLEDIKAPDCFEIERALQKELDIPVFHDDQHGTAIIACAALKNACELTNRKPSDVKVVFTGAGAAALATAKMLVSIGVQREKIYMFDVYGLVYQGRPEDMFPEKEYFAQETSGISLTDALVGADVFIGLSVGGILSGDMLKTMNNKPIIFAMANPTPEITYEDAKNAVPDAIIATGRSDYPNQVNNVLGFPFVFRGALDCRARDFTEEMKIAAVDALAALAKEDVPETVLLAYNANNLSFGPDYLIPKPFDPRVLLWVAPAVARAAEKSGVARAPIQNFEEYIASLDRLMEKTKVVIQPLMNRARLNPRRIIFTDGEHEKILRTVYRLVDEGICIPILIGNPKRINAKLEELHLNLPDVTIIDPNKYGQDPLLVEKLWKLRQRKGITKERARRALTNETVLGCMLIHTGVAEGLLGGISIPYADTLRPAIAVLGKAPNAQLVSGTYVMLVKGRRFFFGDCTVNVKPTAEELAHIAVNTANVAQTFGDEPSIAMLSYSDFGTHRTDKQVQTIREAIKIVRKIRPDLKIDGEMQADTAVSSVIAEDFAFSDIAGKANVLIFPDLVSGNIAYKLLSEIGKATAIGPVITGLAKPINALSMGARESEVFNMAAITVNQVLDQENK
jgi:malate dehydrogenase (oxaloacetate-decarboxylating)(NADP+)